MQAFSLSVTANCDIHTRSLSESEAKQAQGPGVAATPKLARPTYNLPQKEAPKSFSAELQHARMDTFDNLSRLLAKVATVLDSCHP